MGEIAALGTALSWSFTSIQFTLAGRRVGSQAVNRTRLVLALLYLSLAHLLLEGELWPIHAEAFRWAWLGVSGVVGLVLGDACLFQSFVLIGPRRAMLLMTLAPVIGALLAWVWLGETLQPVEIGAVALTIGGVAWVVSERQAAPAQEAPAGDRRQYTLGVLLGIGGATGQALGLVLSKKGLSDDFSSLSATLIRMLVAVVAIWLFALVQRQAGETLGALRDKKALWFTAGGAFTGPFVGVWLSMVAVQHAHVGIASALMASSPIALIPLSYWIFDERISPRSVGGTIVALVGVTIIFLT
ncbi:MAG: DMT family transporter [Anaerolineae bacterium]|jgi:drug/metabolite transporter (DMT)-like permease